MIQLNEVIIGKVICHRICNDELKSIISNDTIDITNTDDSKNISEILLKPFQNSEMSYEFYHEIDIDLNVIYKISQDITTVKTLFAKVKISFLIWQNPLDFPI